MILKSYPLNGNRWEHPRVVTGAGVFSGIVLMAAPLALALARILKLPGQ